MSQLKQPNLTLRENARILLIRLGAIGDVLMASPVAEVLRDAYPHAFIAWAVEPLSAPLVHGNPYVDEVIQIEHSNEWIRMLRPGQFLNLSHEMRDLSQQLRAYQFDLAFDLQGLYKSGLIARLSGAPRRIGPVPSREFTKLFMTETVTWPSHPTRITEGYTALLAPLGLSTTARRPVLEVAEADQLAARDFLAAQGMPAAPYAACCISSSRAQKNWEWPRWGELADQLWERERLHTVFVGGPERRVDTLRLVESSASHPVSSCGYTTLMQSAAIVQDAAVVIGVDTGLTYAGLCHDTPTVALYGSTDPGWLFAEPAAAVCFHPMPCTPCQRRPTCKGYDCMAAITVKEVADTVHRVMERSRVLV